jgi:hypothetical protein
VTIGVENQRFAVAESRGSVCEGLIDVGKVRDDECVGACSGVFRHLCPQPYCPGPGGIWPHALTGISKLHIRLGWGKLREPYGLECPEGWTRQHPANRYAQSTKCRAHGPRGCATRFIELPFQLDIVGVGLSRIGWRARRARVAHYDYVATRAQSDYEIVFIKGVALGCGESG